MISDRELLEAILLRWELIRSGAVNVPFVYETLAHRCSEQEIYDRMEALCDIEALSCGVSLRTAWIEQEYLEKHFPDLCARNHAARGL